MNTSWWKKSEELDPDQKKFIKLPPTGRHQLEGPPGSGKTNLLLLRAEFTAGSGDKNILIITYTNSLADFIRSGISSKGLIRPEQIRTYHSWASEHVLHQLGVRAIEKDTDFDEDARQKLLQQVIEANGKLTSKKLYSAIFVDEAQDLTIGEIENLICLSDNVCICGDIRQSVFNRDGLEVAARMGLTLHKLSRHFRIGQRIAAVADRIIPPAEGEHSLEATANYNPKIQGDSRADIHTLESRDAQFEKMLSVIRVQLDAFKDENIGIICGLKASLIELKERFLHTDLREQVVAHGLDESPGFNTARPIHILTIHSAKGAEFRAVHMFGAEELNKFPLNRSKLSFTAVTRAKTSLDVYKTGNTNVNLENAFSQPQHFDLDDLFTGS